MGGKECRIQPGSSRRRPHRMLRPRCLFLNHSMLTKQLTSFAGGWNNETHEFPTDIKQEIAQAFENVDRCLKAAGGKGWSQVYRVNSYHVGFTNDITGIMAENYQKWMPDHKPIWTEIGVERLGADKMRVEIEVVAHVG